MAKDPVDKLTHALCGLGRPFEIFNSKRKLFYYHLVTPQCRTHGVILLCAQRTAMPHSPTSDRCDQLIFRGNIRKKSAGRKNSATPVQFLQFTPAALLFPVQPYHLQMMLTCLPDNFLDHGSAFGRKDTGPESRRAVAYSQG